MCLLHSSPDRDPDPGDLARNEYEAALHVAMRKRDDDNGRQRERVIVNEEEKCCMSRRRQRPERKSERMRVGSARVGRKKVRQVRQMNKTHLFIRSVRTPYCATVTSCTALLA